MIAGLDSSTARPTLEQARAARAAGVRVWGVYLPPGVGLEAPWDLASVQVLQAADLVAFAYASGNDDPEQLAATARAWGVRGCLDDEDGIRSTVGGWQQAWLDASGFGLYGGAARHVGIRARFHVLAEYPGGDPGATWSPAVPRPRGPLGWQWQGSHVDEVIGLEVDSLWLDDWFVSGGRKPMQVECQRPDGTGRDRYTLVDGHVVHHVVRWGDDAITFRDDPPGSWSELTGCGWRGSTPYLQGLGTDAGVTLFEITEDRKSVV